MPLSRRLLPPAALLAALVVLTPMPLTAGGAPTAYFREVPDLPVMPGLAEVPGAGMTFDKPGGRLVELYAQGEAAPHAVLEFYRRTLPRLGWAPAGAARFLREDEELEIAFDGDGEQLTVRFVLSPR